MIRSLRAIANATRRNCLAMVTTIKSSVHTGTHQTAVDGKRYASHTPALARVDQLALLETTHIPPPASAMHVMSKHTKHDLLAQQIGDRAELPALATIETIDPECCFKNAKGSQPESLRWMKSRVEIYEFPRARLPNSRVLQEERATSVLDLIRQRLKT